ncbi:MAG: hypothetical protein V8S08_13635 [Lachnoclostridium sp.]
MDIKWNPKTGKKMIEKIMAKDRLVILLLVGILLVVIALPTGRKNDHGTENAIEDGTGNICFGAGEVYRIYRKTSGKCIV